MKAIAFAALLFGSAVNGKCVFHEYSSEELAKENMHGLFAQWRREYKKMYNNIDEEITRFGIFKNNLERIAKSNDEYYNGDRTFTLRMNQFGDMTDEEFHDYYKLSVCKCLCAQSTFIICCVAFI